MCEADTSFHNVPLQKIFDFPQPETTGCATYPQVQDSLVVREQPYGSELYPEPMYVTKKGRSHTPSQLPEDHGATEYTDSRSEYDTPEPPFTPPDEVPSHGAIATTPDILLHIDGPSIQFSMYYDIQRRTLSVHLHQAFNLPSIHGPQDSFVVIFLLPTRDIIHQSVTISNNRDPQYKQIFEFGGILAEEVYQQVLVCQVYYSDKFAHDHLVGSVLVPLKEADLYGIVMTKRIGEGHDLLKVRMHLCRCSPYLIMTCCASIDHNALFWGGGTRRFGVHAFPENLEIEYLLVCIFFACFGKLYQYTMYMAIGYILLH